MQLIKDRFKKFARNRLKLIAIIKSYSLILLFGPSNVTEFNQIHKLLKK